MGAWYIPKRIDNRHHHKAKNNTDANMAQVATKKGINNNRATAKKN